MNPLGAVGCGVCLPWNGQTMGTWLPDGDTVCGELNAWTRGLGLFPFWAPHARTGCFMVIPFFVARIYSFLCFVQHWIFCEIRIDGLGFGPHWWAFGAHPWGPKASPHIYIQYMSSFAWDLWCRLWSGELGGQVNSLEHPTILFWQIQCAQLVRMHYTVEWPLISGNTVLMVISLGRWYCTCGSFSVAQCKYLHWYEFLYCTTTVKEYLSI